MTTETTAKTTVAFKSEAELRMEAARTETLTTAEACYLRERITCAHHLRLAAVALEAGEESLAWAHKKEAQVARNAVGLFGRKLSKERKAELTKMAAKAAA